MSPRRKPRQIVNRSRKSLLLIFPGPQYDLARAFESRLVGLSQTFKGFVLARSPTPVNLRYGNFLITTTPITGTGGLLSTLKFFLRGLRLSLESRLRRKRIDLIVTYDPLKTGLLGVILARLAKSKLLTEINGDYTAWANYAEVKNPTVRRLKRRLYLSLEKFVLKRADGIKLLYPEQLDYFPRIPESKVVHTFPDYVNIESFRNLGEDKIVLFAGFPLFVKGVDLLVAAFKQVAPKYPDWKLKILGWFPDPTELNACIGGHPQIFHHKPVHHRDMPQHIGWCAIFVLPSRTEAMGRVLLEAMAAGKPRIGSNVGGIPTVITHDHDGLLVEPENVDQLTRALDRLMGDPILRRRLGENGAKRAKREFSFGRYLAQTCELYTQILTDRG
jgi:glycosyltransferase involved in cell wall biosynthesis